MRPSVQVIRRKSKLAPARPASKPPCAHMWSEVTIFPDDRIKRRCPKCGAETIVDRKVV